MNIQPAVAFLLSIEWSMGNGQCPACYGPHPSRKKNWFPPDEVGHKRNCPLARALIGLGQYDVAYDLKPPLEYGEDKILKRLYIQN